MPTPTQMLAQIAAWLPALDAAAHTATGLHSPRSASGGHDEPQLIQCDLFPLDTFTEASVRTRGGLMRLSQQGLITRYEGPDGRKYLQVNTWDKHQKINRPSKPRFPRYDAENCTLTEPSVSPHCTLTEDSLLEQGTGNREQGTGKLPLLVPPRETEPAETANAELVTVAADAAPATASADIIEASKPSKARGTRLPDELQAVLNAAMPRKAI